jgi:hypothetical protein
MAILLAFMLLALMAGAAFGTGRNAQRELALCGEAVLGARAANAADAGLEWFLAWSANDGPRVQAFLAGLEQGAGPEDGAPPPDLPRDWEEGLGSGPRTGPTRQSFTLRVRHLGSMPRAEPAAAGPERAEPGSDPGPGVPDHLWAVTATGRCVVLDRSGRPLQTYRQMRELLLSGPPAAQGRDPARGLRIRAWRAVAGP